MKNWTDDHPLNYGIDKYKAATRSLFKSFKG